jgi:CheY-like chemotaxis protein
MGPAGWRPRVLIVEDNSINARVLQRSLENMHCKCEWAQNGLDGVVAFSNARTTPHPFDIVFMDVEM